jgi:hypothetical protein
VGVSFIIDILQVKKHLVGCANLMLAVIISGVKFHSCFSFPTLTSKHLVQAASSADGVFLDLIYIDHMAAN